MKWIFTILSNQFSTKGLLNMESFNRLTEIQRFVNGLGRQISGRAWVKVANLGIKGNEYGQFRFKQTLKLLDVKCSM